MSTSSINAAVHVLDANENIRSGLETLFNTLLPEQVDLSVEFSEDVRSAVDVYSRRLQADAKKPVLVVCDRIGTDGHVPSDNRTFVEFVRDETPAVPIVHFSSREGDSDLIKELLARGSVDCFVPKPDFKALREAARAEFCRFWDRSDLQQLLTFVAQSPNPEAKTFPGENDLVTLFWKHAWNQHDKQSKEVVTSLLAPPHQIALRAVRVEAVLDELDDELAIILVDDGKRVVPSRRLASAGIVEEGQSLHLCVEEYATVEQGIVRRDWIEAVGSSEQYTEVRVRD